MGQEGPLLPGGGTGQGRRGKKGINIEEKNHSTDYQQQTKLNFKVISWLGGLDFYLVIFFRVKSDFLYCRKQTKTMTLTCFVRKVKSSTK